MVAQQKHSASTNVIATAAMPLNEWLCMVYLLYTDQSKGTAFLYISVVRASLMLGVGDVAMNNEGRGPRMDRKFHVNSQTREW